jgi:hypothetical protein
MYKSLMVANSLLILPVAAAVLIAPETVLRSCGLSAGYGDSFIFALERPAISDRY